MFRTTRRRLLFLISAVLPAIPAALGIYLKVSGQNIQWRWVATGMVLLLILSSWLAYLNNLKPVRDLQSAVFVLLDAVGQPLLELGKSDGLTLRLNCLMIYRPKRWLFCRRYLRIRWELGMDYQPDWNAEFHISKGVAGEALRRRKPLLVNMELPENQQRFGFTEKERQYFADLTAIWSFPIFELDKDGNFTGKFLGTLNLDTTTPGAIDILAPPQANDNIQAADENIQYDKYMSDFRELVSKVASC